MAKQIDESIVVKKVPIRDEKCERYEEFYKVVVRPALMYSSKCSALNTEKIETKVAEMRMLRRMGGLMGLGRIGY